MIALLAVLIGWASDGWALNIEPDAVFVRVIDVGAGHSTVVRMPGDHFMVYDASNFQDDGASAFTAIDAAPPSWRGHCSPDTDA